MIDPCNDHGRVANDQHSMRRRDFLRVVGLGAPAVGAAGLPILAGPFEDRNEYLELIPTDKKLDPRWIASLASRGEPTIYRNDELRTIGMPIGGIGAGHVYLGGDGRLWLWDIFNRQHDRGLLGRGSRGETYLDPLEQVHPFDQGLAIRVTAGGTTRTRHLDRSGFSDVRFRGRYPMATVNYRDPECPVEVTLEAWSPFIPLDVENSSYPAVVLDCAVRNHSDRAVVVNVGGRLENPVCLDTGAPSSVLRRNRILRRDGLTVLEASATAPAPGSAVSRRPEIVFDDFESPTYDRWTSAGTAFGDGPIEQARVPGYQGALGGKGKRVVNSHASAPGKNVREKDSQTGTLTSRPFAIERRHINFLIGGGNHAGKTCLQLLVDDRVVRSATGRNDNRMSPASFDVSELEGRTARLEIVDRESGGWGNIGIDQIVFSDRPVPQPVPLAERPDFGTLALALAGPEEADTATAAVVDGDLFAAGTSDVSRPFGEKLTGALARTLHLAPGEEHTVRFVFTWFFPNLTLPRPFKRRVGRYYETRFTSASGVAESLAPRLDRLHSVTRRWTDTWYDSTLPWWLLDRTMANTSTLATSTCYLLRDGRFYAWEGIACCPGTCAHVWHYAQAPGRLFPAIERDLRERVDFGLAFQDDGRIGYRGELHNHHADDGQCGRILGVYREHQMSADDGFLKRLYPRVKKALEFMIRHDGNDDGILEGAQPNTLDAAWYGKISFVSSLYLAALRAGEAMAGSVGDSEFARRCGAIARRGGHSILELYNGEYFVQIEDPSRADAIGVGNGCYIDQIFGQTWAHWVGLGRLFDRDRQLSALRALWKYNFVPDVGPFRERFKSGRWYATAGDAGLLMSTWPKGGKDRRWEKHWQAMYFNECMTGFEWQVAAHMIWEGHDQPDLLQNGLAIARAIHDRYDARLRNPYNEIECSDHYARAMASYGVFQAVCGFEYHGPRGHIGFAPRLGPEDFRCAFTTAEGWGTFSRVRRNDTLRASLDLKYGKLHLRSLALAPGAPRGKLAVDVDGAPVPSTAESRDDHLLVTFPGGVQLSEGQSLTVSLG